MTESIASERSLDERLGHYLSSRRTGGRAPEVLALTGDASDRRYFRVSFADQPSIVLAVHTGPIDFATLPFANVAELLEQVPLPIPRILGHSDADGIIEQTDLGDLTLQTHVAAIDAAARRDLYREAIALVERLQRRGTELTSDRYIPYRIAFDVEKLTWEMNFFVRHFLEAYRGASLSPSAHDGLAEEFHAMVSELAAEPRVLCHRDYHSRNLMVAGNHLHVIDFQDARMGPDTYDLASFLRDSYVELPDEEVEAFIDSFLGMHPDPPPAAEFRRRFDLMALQRNLKALGTFGYQATTRANPVYAQYVPRTLTYARRPLERYPRFARLRALLAEHVEELS
jgi:aminoglycoside/choline kinase family phosphotransferase